MTAALLATILLSVPGDLETADDRDRLTLAGQASFEASVPWVPIDLDLQTGDNLALDVVLAAAGGCEAWFRDLRSTLPVPDPSEGTLRLSSGERRVLRLSCEALTAQSLSLLAGAVGLEGAAVVEVWSAPEPERPSELLASASAPAAAWSETLGRTVLHLRAGASASVGPLPGTVSAIRVMARSLDSGRLSVATGGPDGATLAQMPLDRRWRWRGPIRIRANEGTAVCLSAVGGSIDLDNLRVGPHTLRFADEAGAPGAPALELPGALRLIVDHSLSSPGQLSAAHRLVAGVSAPATELVDPVEVQVTRDESLPPQGYRLAISADGAELAAADPAGAQWGLQEAAERVCRTSYGAELLAGVIHAAPALQWRGAEIDLDHEGELEPALRSLVACRFTHVVLDGPHAGFLRDPMIADDLVDAFETAVPLGLAVVPVLRAWGVAVLRDRPMLAAGVTAEPEDLVLVGSTPTALSHPNVLATTAVRPEVTDPDTARVLEEGADFLLVPGDTSFGPAGFSPSARRWSIVRTEGGRIADGQTVRVTYDYIAATGTLSAPACPADPELLTCLLDSLARLIAATHPSQVLLDFGPVPARGLDRRCSAAGVTVADATASVVRELALLARGLDSDLRLIVSALALGEPSVLTRVPGNVVLLVPGDMGEAEAAWARRGRAVILLDDAPGPGSALLAAGAVSLAGDGCIGALAVLRPGRAPGVEDEVAVAYWRGGAD